MSQLSFQLIFGSSELSSVKLPVEVRDSEYGLVRRVLSSDTIDVDPGKYWVTVQTPAGQDLSREVSVGEGESKPVVLAPTKADQSPSEWHENQLFLLETRRVSATLPSPPLVARLLAYSGTILNDVHIRYDEQWINWDSYPVPGTARCFLSQTMSQTTDVRLIHLRQPGYVPLNVTVPVSPMYGCSLVFRRSEVPARSLGEVLGKPSAVLPVLQERLTMEVLLGNPVANTLLHYYERGLLGDVATLMQPMGQVAEGLLEEKLHDPIGASLGAYILMRLGDISRFRWAQNLHDWFDWLPDGVVILAEFLAQRGDHEAALRTLLTLQERGLPIFTDGLSLAVDRLSLYVSVGRVGSIQTAEVSDQEPEDHEVESSSKEPPHAQQPQPTAQVPRRTDAEALLAKLETYATFADLGKVVLTYTGGPSHGDRYPVTLAGTLGADIAPHLH